MQCPKCKVENPEGARYCNQCGAFLDSEDLQMALPQSFEEKIEKIQRYLPQGLTTKILNQRERIEGERKHVTVMFCDMAGFMPLVERLGPEAAYMIMDEVYEILIQQVNDFEGTVNEMTGDGIMALFGAPIALEEAPQRALWAAHAIHREIAAFNKQKRGLDPIRMRIGVHAGPVVVGTLGNDLRVDFKAVGDTVNLASRMEQLAAPGTTYATREVFRLARGMFKFENLGPKVIKGRDQSIHVYRVRTSRTDVYRPRPGTERIIFSAMVGRDTELDQLEAQVQQLIAGSGGVINIIGEAGIGKSRLMAELKQRAAIRQVLLLEGRAISMGRNLSFHPMVDLLKQWTRIKVEHDAEEAFVRLGAAIMDLFGKQAGELLPFVATLMGLGMPAPYSQRLAGIEGEALEKLIRKTVRELFTRLSAARPLVIVVDDMHWSDRSSIELIESLYRLAASEQILFINLFRPGYVGTGQRILESLKTNPLITPLDIVLEPLDANGSEKLIANMLNLQGAHHTIIGQIVQRASGNPYFIEEVVRSFIDEGAIVVRGGKFEVTSKFDRVTIPNTISDVLMARIDRLDEEARNLLKVAAVIGRNFFYRILAEVADSVRDLDRQLTYLKKTELIRERRRLEELEYLFKHALAQEAAYASILPEKRKALHLKVADTIQKVFAEKLHAFYGMLAYHYSRGENLDKAEAALIKAGEEALKSSASSEALHYYREALYLYRSKAGDAADSAKVAQLEKNIALALYNRGQYEEALEYFNKAQLSYWGRPANHPATSTLVLVFGLGHILAGVYLPWLKFRRRPTPQDEEALDLFFKKLKCLSIVQPRQFFIDSMQFYRKLVQFDLAQVDAGFGLFAGASSLFSFSGISFWLSRGVLDFIRRRIRRDDVKAYIIYDFFEVLHQYLAGNWHDIEAIDDDLVEQNLKLGEVYWASLPLYWHGLHHLYSGELDAAWQIVIRLEEIADTYGNEATQLLSHLLSTGMLLDTGQLPEAMDRIDKGIDFAQQTNTGLALIHLLSCKAMTHILMHDREAAEQHMEQAALIRRDLVAVPWQLAMFLKTRTALDLYRLREETRNGMKTGAPKYHEKALRSCRAFVRQTRKVAQHRTEALRMMGDYFWLNQNAKQALKWWRKSIREGQRLGARLELARTYFEVGRRLLDDRSPYASLDGTEAPAYLKKARTAFEAMGLERDLDKLCRQAIL